MDEQRKQICTHAILFFSFFFWQEISEPAVNQRKHKSRFQAAWNQDFTELNVLLCLPNQRPADWLRLGLVLCSHHSLVISTEKFQRKQRGKPEEEKKWAFNRLCFPSFRLFLNLLIVSLSFRWSLCYSGSREVFFLKDLSFSLKHKHIHMHSVAETGVLPVRRKTSFWVWHSAHIHSRPADTHRHTKLCTDLKANIFFLRLTWSRYKKRR